MYANAAERRPALCKTLGGIKYVTNVDEESFAN